jgi:hypothetical protein
MTKAERSMLERLAEREDRSAAAMFRAMVRREHDVAFGKSTVRGAR